jgi:hypothetical protein
MRLLSYLTSTGKVHRALRTLENLGTQIRGPFLTPQRNSIYVVNECILTESELVGLYQADNRSRETVAKALSEFKRLQTS